jgi:hypothetical protein
VKEKYLLFSIEFLIDSGDLLKNNKIGFSRIIVGGSDIQQI